MAQLAMLARAPSAPPAALALTMRLRLETRDAHDRIKANPQLQRLIAPDLTREEYRALLARLFGHHAPAETSLAEAMDLLPPAMDLPRRLRRTALMAVDLAALGFSPVRIEALPRCAGMAVRRREQAWGLLYALEESRLAGPAIACHLSGLLGLRPATGAACMAPNRSEAGPLRRGFKAMLDEAGAIGELDAEAVVDAARLAFERLDRWVAGG